MEPSIGLAQKEQLWKPSQEEQSKNLALEHDREQFGMPASDQNGELALELLGEPELEQPRGLEQEPCMELAQEPWVEEQVSPGRNGPMCFGLPWLRHCLTVF